MTPRTTISVLCAAAAVSSAFVAEPAFSSNVSSSVGAYAPCNASRELVSLVNASYSMLVPYDALETILSTERQIVHGTKYRLVARTIRGEVRTFRVYTLNDRVEVSSSSTFVVVQKVR